MSAKHRALQILDPDDKYPPPAPASPQKSILELSADELGHVLRFLPTVDVIVLVGNGSRSLTIHSESLNSMTSRPSGCRRS